jgi:type IV pilus assembly protein PilA
MVLNNHGSLNGFTLIELLVVMIIVGILASIALPSFLSQTFRARNTEAQSYVSTLLQAQQLYRADNNGYASTIDELNASIPEETDNFTYVISNNNGISTITGSPKDDALNTVRGKVFPQSNSNGDIELMTVMCSFLPEQDTSMANIQTNADCP